jgi:hypothetical protein
MSGLNVGVCLHQSFFQLLVKLFVNDSTPQKTINPLHEGRKHTAIIVKP